MALTDAQRGQGEGVGTESQHKLIIPDGASQAIVRVLTFILNKVVKNWGNLSGGVKRSDLHLKSFFFFSSCYIENRLVK